MDDSTWKVKKKDILSVDIQYNVRTGTDFAAVKFRDGNKEKFAFVKNLADKPADMDINDWCAAVLSTHYLVMAEEKKRGGKIPLAR